MDNCDSEFWMKINESECKFPYKVVLVTLCLSKGITMMHLLEITPTVYTLV